MSPAKVLWPRATLFAAFVATVSFGCSSAKGPSDPVGGTGGEDSGGSGGSEPTGGKGGGGTGGKGTGGTGGTGTAGTGGTGTAGTGGTGTAGTGGTGTAGTGGTGTAGTGGGTAGTGGGGAGGEVPSMGLPTCTMDPAATAPALKKTPVVRLPNGDQAGQVIGVPGEKGIYILGHRTGKVYYAVDGKLDPTPMASVSIKSNAPQDEQGLLGIALNPKFAENHLFYLLYTASNSNIHIEELERTAPNASKSVRAIWDKARAGGGAFHNGGQIWFNPKDGGKAILYHSVGNNANVGQSGMADGVAGRVLVHDFTGDMIKSTTLSYGLRNPYRMTIDRGTGDMYIGEIDDPPGGAIFASPYSATVKDFGYRGGGIKNGLTGKEGGKAIIGGVVYRGMKIPGACGRYFYAGWPGGGIKSLVVKDGKLMGGAADHGGLGVGGISSFGEDGDGEIYFSTQGGEVYRIEAM
jgi:hypothetical protein